MFIGGGRFIDSRSVEVAGENLRFKKAVIATGARASAPPIAGLDQVEYLTNETVFSLSELPKRLAVIGAGPIGCEMAQAFARFGSEAFLVETLHGIPWCTYTEPEIALVGLYKKHAHSPLGQGMGLGSAHSEERPHRVGNVSAPEGARRGLMVNRARKAGDKIIQEPRHCHWGTEAFVADSDGYIWAFDIN